MSTGGTSVFDRPKRVRAGGLELACYESEGRGGPGILLLHGNSSSARIYRHQLEGPLGQRLRLVALDLPGHGASEHAGPRAGDIYRLRGYADVVAEAATALGLERGIFVGWSLSGDILLQATKRLSGAAGFLIFGTGPLSNPYDPAAFLGDFETSAAALGITADLSAADRKRYAESFFRPGFGEPPDFVLADIAATDPKSRENLGVTGLAGDYDDEIEILEALDRPVAIVHGLEEQLVSLPFLQQLTIPTLWRGQVQTVDGAGHAVQWERAEVFDDLLEQFAQHASD